MSRINPRKVGNPNTRKYELVYASSLGNKGADGKMRGQFPFVPLFTVQEFEDFINNKDVENSPLFKYSFGTYRFVTKDDSGNARWNSVELIDSGMRISDGLTRNDVVCDLGLTLPLESRVAVPVLSSGLTYKTKADFSSYSTKYFLPVLWNPDTTFNRSRYVADESGKIAYLVFDKPSQISNLLETLKETTPEVLEWRDGNKINEEYDYEGFGQSFTYNKDTSKAYDSHKFVSGVPVRESHYKSARSTVEGLVDEVNEYICKFSGGYMLMNLDSDFEAGNITEEQYDDTVYAWSVRKFLTTLGHEIPETSSDTEVIDLFQQLLPKYSVSSETQLGNAITSEQIVTSNRPSEVSNEVDDDNPF